MLELLAPAGGEESAYAAINSGADAIYLGLTSFSARSGAENFDREALSRLLGYAHSAGVHVHVAMNTLVKQSELEEFLTAAVEVWNAGADAIIIQDIFIAKYLKEAFPQMVVHLSTQAGTCNVYGAELAKKYRIDRVILARETKLNDIRQIAKIIETEVFVQGALCTCFSGQCYMSSFAGGNSGNRGRCKQPCRKKYTINRSGYEEPAYRISLSDLCVGENVAELAKAGVQSFKIEGRMRRPEYVAAAVRYYRSLFDGERADIGALKRTYNRGNYTAGLAFGQNKNFISSAVQGHIGEYVGRIAVKNGKYVCESRQNFGQGDCFKILRDGKEVGGGTFGGTTNSGFVISSRQRLKDGDKAFVTTDVSLNNALLSQPKKLHKIKIRARFAPGERPYVAINGFGTEGAEILQSAQRRPLAQADVERCFNKTDVYPFFPEYESIEIAGDVFMAASSLNELRRSAYASYFNHLAGYGRERLSPVFTIPQTPVGKNTKTAVIASDLRGVKADIGIFKPADYFRPFGSFIGEFVGEKFLYLPPFLSGEELEGIKGVLAQFDGIYCEGYYGIMLSEVLKIPLFAGTGFNISNTFGANSAVAKYYVTSKELNYSESLPLSAHNAFYLAAGDVKVMDLIYCPFEKTCGACDKRNVYALTDEEGRAFPLRRYQTGECRFEVYNCASVVAESCACGKLFDCTLQKDANAVLENGDNADALKKLFKTYTKGHSRDSIL